MNKNRLIWLVGIIGPMYYFILLFVLGLMWPGYNPISQFMSELGGIESPVKSLTNIAAFMGVGVITLIFSIGFYLEFGKNVSAKIAFLNLIIAGFFMILVGFFPCDAKCINVSTTGKLHTLTSIPQSITLPLAGIFSAFVFVKNKKWGKKWFYISLILGISSMATGPLMAFSFIEPIGGVIQRLGIGLSLLWLFLVSTKKYIEVK